MSILTDTNSNAKVSQQMHVSNAFSKIYIKYIMKNHGKLHSLISAFPVHCLNCIISFIFISIRNFKPPVCVFHGKDKRLKEDCAIEGCLKNFKLCDQTNPLRLYLS